MTLRSQALFTTLLLLAITTPAQDTEGFKSAANLGVTLTDGNSETMNSNIGITTKRVAGDDEIKAGIEFNYGETQNETVTQNVKADGQFRKMLGERLYGYAGLDFLSDEIAEVGYRFAIGPGAGMDLIKNDTTRLNAEAGTVWVAEELGDDTGDDFVAWRVSQTFEYDLSESARIWQKVTLIPEFGDFDNYNFSGEVGVESTMTDNVKLRIVLQDRYDNTPAIKDDVELEKNDITLIGGIAISL